MHILRFCAVLASFVLVQQAALPQAESYQVSQFSGKQVPRFEALRYSAVHGRQGPSLEHPILWRYEQLGLPVLIVRETHGWRRVRDPDGAEVWVQARMLSDEARGLVIQDAELRRHAESDSAPVAALRPGVVVDLIVCEASACQVRIEKLTGWMDRSVLWGTDVNTQGL